MFYSERPSNRFKPIKLQAVPTNKNEKRKCRRVPDTAIIFSRQSHEALPTYNGRKNVPIYFSFRMLRVSRLCVSLYTRFFRRRLFRFGGKTTCVFHFYLRFFFPPRHAFACDLLRSLSRRGAALIFENTTVRALKCIFTLHS